MLYTLGFNKCVHFLLHIYIFSYLRGISRGFSTEDPSLIVLKRPEMDKFMSSRVMVRIPQRGRFLSAVMRAPKGN